MIVRYFNETGQCKIQKKPPQNMRVHFKLKHQILIREEHAKYYLVFKHYLNSFIRVLFALLITSLSLLNLLLHLILQAQYRLGSCFSAFKKYSEAMGPFSRSLQLLLNDSSSTEKDREDTLNQLLTVALKHPGTTTLYTSC